MSISSRTVVTTNPEGVFGPRRGSLLFPAISRVDHGGTRARGGHRRAVAWRGVALHQAAWNVCTVHTRAPRQYTKWNCEGPFSSRECVHAPLCAQAGATRAERARPVQSRLDRNPTDVQHVYVSQATLTLQFMRALTAPQPSRPARVLSASLWPA